MIGVMNLGGLSESTDRFRQQMGIIGDRDFFRNLRLRLFRGMDHMRLVFHQRPFETSLRAVHIETLTILPRHVVKKPPDMGREIRIANLDVTSLHRELVAGLFRDVFANCA